MTELHLTPRPTVDLLGAVPAGQRALYRLEQAIADTDLPKRTYELIKIRASQINGCAFCLEMHHHDAVEQGETAERYLDVTLERFANPYLNHRLADIAQNHGQKIERRIGAFLDLALHAGHGRPLARLAAINGGD